MRSRITLSTPLITRILSTLPGVENGRVIIDLGSLGIAALKVDQLHIERDVVQLPVKFHPGGSPDVKGVDAKLHLTNWRVRDGILWFTLERIGIFRGALFQAAQSALVSLINKIIQRRLGDSARLQREDGRLGIPIESILRERWGLNLPVGVSGIEVEEGVTLFLR